MKGQVRLKSRDKWTKPKKNVHLLGAVDTVNVHPRGQPRGSSNRTPAGGEYKAEVGLKSTHRVRCSALPIIINIFFVN